jgi:hypothetical protein
MYFFLESMMFVPVIAHAIVVSSRRICIIESECMPEPWTAFGCNLKHSSAL